MGWKNSLEEDEERKDDEDEEDRERDGTRGVGYR